MPLPLHCKIKRHDVSTSTPYGAIAFIGGGNMATSLIGGLIANGHSPQDLFASDPEPAQLDKLRASFGITTTTDNDEALEHAATVVLSVKPQVMAPVTKALAEAAKRHRPLLVSIAAGVREPDIRSWLGYDAAIVRTMPNTPALVGSGATALFANPFVSTEEQNCAQAILDAVGITLWVDEEQLLDTVTAVSGSGPAYCFLLMELMAAAGEELGLDKDTAVKLTLQTVYGAAKMALESPEPPGTLRERVTSPGGTTERALQIFEQGDVKKLVLSALKGARDRSVELGAQLGDD